MSVNTNKVADYCPACGAEVESAEVVAADEDLIGQGVYESDAGHAIIDSGTVEIYEHAADAGGASA